MSRGRELLFVILAGCALTACGHDRGSEPASAQSRDVTFVADVGGFSGGPYRFVIHTNPVCTSPNGFSAGPPFVPPGTGAPVVVPAVIYHQGTATLTTRVPGIALGGPNGVEGKSLVLHASESGPLDAQPGVPNDRVACGVIGPVPTLF